MKNYFLILAVVGIGYWFFQSSSDLNRLMEKTESSVITSSSGVSDMYPEPGSEIDADMLAEYGVPTVLYLYMESCNACEPVEKAIDRLIAYRPDVVVKRLHVKYGYGLRLFSEGKNLWSTHTPFIVIYDNKGKRVSADIGEQGEEKSYDGYHMLFDWANAEAKVAYKG